MTNKDLDNFYNWFATKDLKHLEDVRDYVSMHSLQNVSDLPDSKALEIAKSTVCDYIENSLNQNEEVFDYYRN